MPKTILVVDDLAIYREPIEAVLRADGFQVVTASNGKEALVAASRQPPDLILLDLGMPVMDGLTALAHLRQGGATRHTPVLVLSCDADRGHIVAAVKLGISGYVLKSQFSLRAMLDSIRGALDPKPEAAGAPAKAKGAPEAAGVSHAAAPSAVRTHAGPQKKPGAPGGPPPARPPEASADLKSLKPMMSRTELEQKILAEGELTGFSPTVSQVLKITSSRNCSMDQVAKAVSQDHAVALKILKLANSSVYSRGDRVDTVQKAVLRIGMQSIRQAVLNIGVVERFSSISFEKHLSTPMFWEHSIATGIIASQLAQSLGHSEPDIAFTAGLLHDLGRVLFAERLGEDYLRVLDAAISLQLPLEQVESRLLMMTHAEVMDKVLRGWRFPKELGYPIVCHHAEPRDVRTLAPHQVPDVLRLGLADRLAHAMMLGCSGNDSIYPTEEHCRVLGVSPEAILKIEEKSRQETDDTKFALLSSGSSASWPRYADQVRASLTVPFRPVYVSASPEVDAFRIFFKELAGRQVDAGEPPNLAIVHIAVPKERAGLATMLADAEKAAGAANLPALLLSPGGQTGLDGEATRTRKIETCSTPAPVTRLVGAINRLLATSASDDKGA